MDHAKLWLAMRCRLVVGQWLRTSASQIVIRTSGLADRYTIPSNHPTARPDLQIRIRLCYKPSPYNIPEKKGYYVPFMKGFSFGCSAFVTCCTVLALHTKYPDRSALGSNRFKDKRFFISCCLFTGFISREQSDRGMKFPQSSVDVKNEWMELYLYSSICLRGVDIEKL